MENFKKILLSCSLGIIIAGCQTTTKEKESEKKEIKKPQYVTVLTDKKTVGSVSKLCDTMLATFYKNNYQKYSDLTLKESRAKNNIFSQMSQMIIKRLGKVEEKTFLGALQKGPATVFMWRVKFEMPLQKVNKNYKVEWLIKLVVSRVDDQLKVVGFFIE